MKDKSKLWKKASSIVDACLGVNCLTCKYNKTVYCERTDRKGIKCQESIFPVGYERKLNGND